MMVLRFSAQLCPAIAAALFALFAAFGCGPAMAADNGGLPAVPAVSPSSSMVDYRIGPLDKLNITVFQVRDLTVENLQVDAGGQILLPLIGSVTAAGKTTSELSAEIAQRLAERYMQSPQVSVVVAEAVSQKVSVEGAVTEAGVFEMRGRTSLLEAVAMAKGPTKEADLTHVAVIRSVDGIPQTATFDYQAIEEGKAGDPEVLGNDIVVVADSKSKEFWHGATSWLPALWVLSLIH